MEQCIMEESDLFLNHNLLINDSITKISVLGSEFHLNKVNNNQVKVGKCTSYFWWKFKSKWTSKWNCKKSFYQLYKLNQLKKYLGDVSLKSLIN